MADLKLLPPGDGSAGLIVAQGSEIKRLDGNGNVVQRYDVPGEDSWFGIALDPDGKSFWAQTNAPGNVYRFDIASGAVDRGPLPAAAAAYGICVKGTRLAALDNAAPSISVTTPAEGARFVQGQAVAASYACADDRFGTGIASCGGPVPSGAALDTGSVGTKSFKVDAADVAGNTAGFSRTYTVVAPTPGTTPGRVLVSVSFRYAASDKATRLTSFTVKNIPSGARLQVSCAPKQKGAKCPGQEGHQEAREGHGQAQALHRAEVQARYRDHGAGDQAGHGRRGQARDDPQAQRAVDEHELPAAERQEAREVLLN